MKVASKKRRRGQPKLDILERALQCPCRGASGTSTCKYSVICDNFNMCKRGCLTNKTCNKTYPDEVRESPNLKRKLSHDYKEKDQSNFLEENYLNQLVEHQNLSLETATVTDLGKAYGRKTFFVSSAKKTIYGLQNRMDLRETIGKKSEKTDINYLRRYFHLIRMILSQAIRTFAGGPSETHELKKLFLNEEFREWHSSALLKNAKSLLKKRYSTPESRAVRALMVKTLGNKLAINHQICLKNKLKGAISDFNHLQNNKSLSTKKKNPSGKILVTDL